MSNINDLRNLWVCSDTSGDTLYVVFEGYEISSLERHVISAFCILCGDEIMKRFGEFLHITLTREVSWDMGGF